MGLVEVIAPAQTESRLLFSAGAALALLVRRQLLAAWASCAVIEGGVEQQAKMASRGAAGHLDKVKDRRWHWVPGVKAGELELDDVLQLQVPHWLPLHCTKTQNTAQPVMLGNSGYALEEGIFSLF